MTNKQRELIDALRSGKYKQGKSWLRYLDYYCADGIMCDISGLGEWSNKDRFNILGIYTYKTEYGDMSTIALDKIYDMFGVGSLCGYNDKGMTFEQIADMLEEKLE